MNPAPLSLGTAQLGLPYGVAGRTAVPSAREAEAILDAAAGLGLRMLDTAPAYGEAERRIGDWLRRRPQATGFAIFTKLRLPPAVETADLPALVERAVEASLRRLQTEPIAGYSIHGAEGLHRHGRALVDALLEQRERGRIAALGVSVYNPDEALAALEHPELTLLQHPLNLLDRRLLSGPVAERLDERGTRLHARSALLQGLLTVTPSELPPRLAHAAPALERLAAVLARFGLTPAQAALPWAARQSAECLVVGVDTPEQLRENVAAVRAPLPAELDAALERELGEVPVEVLEPFRWPEG